MAKRTTRSRAFWSGTITFGLVSVPVDLYSGNRSQRASFRLLAPDGVPLERRYFCSREDEEISWSEIIRGYELDGSWVPVTDEELEAIQPEKSRDIDLRSFVPRDDLDPILFQRAYFLVPGGDSVKAYRLLVDAMESTDRAGIATFVMRGKEYLVAILAEKGLLRAETLRFDGEIRDIENVGLPEGKAKASKVKSFRDVISRMTESSLDLDELRDDLADRVDEFARKKKKEGSDVVEREVAEEPEEEEGGEVVDLVAALRKSLGKEAVRAKPKKAKKKSVGKPDLSKLTKDELYERAQERDIPGRSSMTKDELVEALS
ncbi:MAG: Ku protein [Thermoanaerobaculia bacterium]|nr:Ku protein [Thermoanaerobaculia bacterium]